MKKIKILTLFPEIFTPWKDHSIIGRATKDQKVNIDIINFRDYSDDKKHKTVDDTPYGGGDGMLLKVQPIRDCLKTNSNKRTHKILLSPHGTTFNQAKAQELASKDEILFICGHYEGFDQRIESYVDEVISVGNFITTGGEVVAMLLADAIIRNYPKVIKKGSLDNDSFTNDLLDYDSYTRPFDYEGNKVPLVLLSGDHKEIADWRKQNQEDKTKKYKPDMWKQYLKNKNHGGKHEK